MRRQVDWPKYLRAEMRGHVPTYAVLNRVAAPRNELDRTIGKGENYLTVKVMPAVRLSWPGGTSFVLKQSIRNSV
jgi:hypothetical protein